MIRPEIAFCRIQGRGFTSVSTAKRIEAGTGLLAAHSLILQVLEVQDGRFAILGERKSCKPALMTFLTLGKAAILR
jgi:hypothetical protein